MQLLSDLRADLGGVAVNGLTAAEDHVVLLNADVVDAGGDDLGGGEGVGAAELTAGDEDSLIAAHGQALMQHAGCGEGAHRNDDDLAVRVLVLDGKGGLNGVHIVGVGDGGHGGAVQGTVVLHSNAARSIGNLLDANNNLHSFRPPYFLPSRAPEMTICCTSEVPS